LCPKNLLLLVRIIREAVLIFLDSASGQVKNQASLYFFDPRAQQEIDEFHFALQIG
jgi:hypothetical protein